MRSDFNPAGTPLLLIAWRRPHTLRQVIDAIRPVAPRACMWPATAPTPTAPAKPRRWPPPAR